MLLRSVRPARCTRSRRRKAAKAAVGWFGPVVRQRRPPEILATGSVAVAVYVHLQNFYQDRNCGRSAYFPLHTPRRLPIFDVGRLGEPPRRPRGRCESIFPGRNSESVRYNTAEEHYQALLAKLARRRTATIRRRRTGLDDGTATVLIRRRNGPGRVNQIRRFFAVDAGVPEARCR